MTIVTQPCAIKGCLHLVKVEADLADLHSRDFALCNDCESAIVIDTHIVMERAGDMIPGTAKAFALIYNAWNRRRKGVALAHRPQDLGFVIPLMRPLGDRN